MLGVVVCLGVAVAAMTVALGICTTLPASGKLLFPGACPPSLKRPEPINTPWFNAPGSDYVALHRLAKESVSGVDIVVDDTLTIPRVVGGGV
jgi:hypothetical protein